MDSEASSPVQGSGRRGRSSRPLLLQPQKRELECTPSGVNPACPYNQEPQAEWPQQIDRIFS